MNKDQNKCLSDQVHFLIKTENDIDIIGFPLAF